MFVSFEKSSETTTKNHSNLCMCVGVTPKGKKERAENKPYWAMIGWFRLDKAVLWALCAA
jgi:hypothetical protein